MCLVSAISTSIPNQIPRNRLDSWPNQQVLDLAEVIKRLDKIDKALGLKDCKDPEKAAFLAELNERVDAIEKRLDNVRI